MFPSRPFLTAVLLSSFWLGCSKNSATNSGVVAETVQPVEVTTLNRRDLAETLAVVGSIAANESATLRPEIAGIVRTISFEEGQWVKVGQLLVKLDDAELQAQYRQGQARYELSRLSLQRAETLRQTQSTTQVELDRAKTEFSSSEADLALLKVRLERTSILAPFDGLIGSRRVSPGDYVNTQSVITNIDDLNRLKIEFQVPERFFAKVVPGTKFMVTSRSSGNTGRPDAKIPGEVYFASSAIDRATRSSEVKGFLKEVPAGLKPGMFANVELVLSVKQRALTVTEGAILTTPRGNQVIAVRDQGTDKVADFVPVRLGLRSKGLVEIEPLSGTLDDNQSIVASGVGALILFPGAKLEPRPQKEQFRLGGGDR